MDELDEDQSSAIETKFAIKRLRLPCTRHLYIRTVNHRLLLLAGLFKRDAFIKKSEIKLLVVAFQTSTK